MNISRYTGAPAHFKAHTGSRQTVQASTGLGHSNDVQVLGTAVISTVDQSSSGQAQRHAQLVACEVHTNVARASVIISYHAQQEYKTC